MAKSKLARLREQADKVFQQAFCRENPYCECCGKPVSCGHHFFPKSSCSALRYEWDNMIAVCNGCHLKFHSKFGSEIISETVVRRGAKWFQGLMEKKRTLTVKPSQKYYQSIIDKYAE